MRDVVLEGKKLEESMQNSDNDGRRQEDDIRLEQDPLELVKLGNTGSTVSRIFGSLFERLVHRCENLELGHSDRLKLDVQRHRARQQHISIVMLCRS